MSASTGGISRAGTSREAGKIWRAAEAATEFAGRSYSVLAGLEAFGLVATVLFGVYQHLPFGMMGGLMRSAILSG